MAFLKIFLYPTLLLFLPHCTHQNCSDGKPKECLDAEFVPGTNLGGEGFDITKMERKGTFVIETNQWKRKDKTCTLCVNPFVENKKQKLPLSVVDWRAKQSCWAKVSSQLHKSSEALLSSSTSSIENNWKSNLDVTVGDKSGTLILAATNSKLADYSMEKTKNDKYSFASQSMSCEYYSYRVSKKPKLHWEFRNALNELPKVYNSQTKKRFYKFIDNFGTHYITKVKLGGSVQSVTSIRQCQANLKGLSVDEVQMCLEAEASVVVKATITTEAKHCKMDTSKDENKQSFSSLFNDRFTEIKGGHTTEPDLLFSSDKDPSAYKDWLSTVPQYPDIISYSLDSLHELLPTKAPSHKNLRSAISHYILERALWRNCSSPCPAGVRADPRDPCVCQCHNNAAVNQDCCPSRRGMARVIITVQRASGLWGDQTTATDGYVKVLFQKKQVQRTRVILNNNNPHWGTVIDLDDVDLSMGNKVRFEVWDQDSNWDDDLLGNCEPILTPGLKQDVCALQHGRLFYKLEVRCAPSLGGEFCRDYKASPMSQSLQSWFVSRHAHPIPRALLLQMGVFEGLESPKNQSYTDRHY